MAKYVSADALKWAVNQYQKSGHLSKEAALNLVKAAIDAAPNDSVDAIEVVRCKDCKHAYCNSFAAAAGTVLCRYWTNHGGGNQAIMQRDEFCSKGERRDNHAAD